MDPYEIEILRYLYMKRCIGAKHTAAEHTLRGLRKHERGAGRWFLDKLIKNEYLISKPTSYGLQVSINPEKLKEIKIVLREDE